MRIDPRGAGNVTTNTEPLQLALSERSFGWSRMGCQSERGTITSSTRGRCDNRNLAALPRDRLAVRGGTFEGARKRNTSV